MNDDAKIIIRAQNVHKSYSEGEIRTPVLNGCSMHAAEGEFVAVTGPSGAGKSTLLHILGLIDVPDLGEITCRGRNLAGLKESERAAVRNRDFGFVFQAYHLINELSALENVLLPAMLRPWPEYLRGRIEFRERAASLLSRIGLAERLRHKPRQLSGGERQRVAIARALMNSPHLLFCDEPTGNLDEKNSRSVFDLLLELREEEKLTLVLVTHERDYAAAADRVYHIHNGRAEETGRGFL